MTAPAPRAVNPFALAEVRHGRRINWASVGNRARLLEEVLEFPYEALFDPAGGSPLYDGGADAGANAAWIDPGASFERSTELFDPVQGAIGDGYLFAALAAVAWARPYVIAQRDRGIEFHDGATTVRVEVSDQLPLGTPGNYYLYGRSSDPYEIWPAVYEKAYAKWRTGHDGDTPDIRQIAGGDPVLALSQLTGLDRTYFACADMTAHDVWLLVRRNSLRYATYNPMVAYTYASGDEDEGRVYSDATLVAGHAYAILGWRQTDGEEYLSLLNPWGMTEERTDNGAFVLRADAFKRYFEGFGVVA
jgi:calpain family cysteine protease